MRLLLRPTLLSPLPLLLLLLLATMDVATAPEPEDATKATETETETHTETNPTEPMVGSDETSENLNPWLERWKSRRIGFHLESVNPILLKYKGVLLGETTPAKAAPGKDPAHGEEESFPAPGCPADELSSSGRSQRVFVPLCGKTVDLAYLAGLDPGSGVKVDVVGLEGIRSALEEFVGEHPRLGIARVPEAPGRGVGVPAWERFEGNRVSLWRGDLFDLRSPSGKLGGGLPRFVGRFDAVYDRASIVAIEPGLRPFYAGILDRLLRPGGRILLVGLERVSASNPAATSKGPPFSIPEAVVRDLFVASGLGASEGCSYSVALLESNDQLVENPADRKRYPDLDQLLETVYLIRKEPN